MRNSSLLASGRSRGIGAWLVIVFAAFLIALGAVIFAGGVWLLALGGSWYYLIAGAGLAASGLLMILASPTGVWIYLLTCLLTWLWALWEVGTDGWALVPRVVAPTLLAVLALLCLPVLSRRSTAGEKAVAQEEPSSAARHPGRMAAAVFVAVCAAAILAIGGRIGMAEINPAGPVGPAAGVASKGWPEDAGQTTTASGSPQKASTDRDGMAGSDWPAFGGSYLAARYSSLNQISAANVANLKRVWTFHTLDLPSKAANGRYSPETTPIKVGDSLYLCSAKNILIALDAKVGHERWRYDPKVSDDAIPYGATCRGVAYYKYATAGPDDLCSARIIEGTLDARLIAVDAKTGQPCPDFGRNGTVDLWDGMGERVPGWYGNVAAPTIVRGIVVIGGQVKDNEAEAAPPGVIRGYDAITGKLAWAWDMCRPDRTGAPPPGETYTLGTPNMWTSAAGDEGLGYVYVPLGNAAGDYWGGHRKACENEFNSSLVALDVKTGKPVWRFQTVHYDVWDYDLGSQPSLVDFPASGGAVPAVILPSKQGEIYVLDRRTGKSLFPVEERKVPTGGVEPEHLSKTQPFSTYASLARPPLLEKDMWGMSPLDQLWCRIQFRRMAYEGIYTPPRSDRPFLEYPSYNGGSDWGSVAVDLRQGIIIANYNAMANNDRLLTRQEADDRGVLPINVPHEPLKPGRVEYGAMAGGPYAVEVNPGWRQWTGLMCTEPPYGGIRAIELTTGKTLWEKPLGEARENGPFGIPSKLPIDIGTPNNGGSVITAGGLVFIAAATDNLIRAIDIKTGKVLWKDTLPAGGQASPMTY